MDPIQFEQLLDLIRGLVEKNSRYTITGAEDWTMLLVIGGMLVTVIVAMWTDLSGKLTSNRKDSKEEIKVVKQEVTDDIKSAKQEFAKQIDIIWEAQRHCQEECCPRRRESPRVD